MYPDKNNKLPNCPHTQPPIHPSPFFIPTQQNFLYIELALRLQDLVLLSLDIKYEEKDKQKYQGSVMDHKQNQPVGR